MESSLGLAVLHMGAKPSLSSLVFPKGSYVPVCRISP